MTQRFASCYLAKWLDCSVHDPAHKTKIATFITARSLLHSIEEMKVLSYAITSALLAVPQVVFGASDEVPQLRGAHSLAVSKP